MSWQIDSVPGTAAFFTCAPLSEKPAELMMPPIATARCLMKCSACTSLVACSSTVSPRSLTSAKGVTGMPWM